MPALFTLLFKINIALVLFCLGYYAVLRHLTFYTLNRTYLIVSMLFASIYPWIHINNFIQHHQQLTAPVQHIIIQWKAPAVNLVKPLQQPDYWQLAETIFWIGVAMFGIRLVLKLFSLLRLHLNSKPGTICNYHVRLLDSNVGPFSFWRSIYINPEKLSGHTLEKILEHEHIHVSQWHTLDILLAELSTVFYWFNPGIWLMKKAVRENIEFITDRKVLERGADCKQYQYSLLTVSLAGTTNILVNNFNISTIKKRIIMMNTKRSSRINITRYMFVAPVIAILLLAFGISKAAIVKKGSHNMESAKTTAPYLTIAPRIKSTPIKKTGNNTVANSSSIQAIDTIKAHKQLDGVKSFLITSRENPDSINYIINGIDGTRADLKTIDPKIIASINFESAAEFKKYYGSFAKNNYQVLFINTDHSDASKALTVKLRNSYVERLRAEINTKTYYYANEHSADNSRVAPENNGDLTNVLPSSQDGISIISGNRNSVVAVATVDK